MDDFGGLCPDFTQTFPLVRKMKDILYDPADIPSDTQYDDEYDDEYDDDDYLDLYIKSYENDDNDDVKRQGKMFLLQLNQELYMNVIHVLRSRLNGTSIMFHHIYIR